MMIMPSQKTLRGERGARTREVSGEVSGGGPAEGARRAGGRSPPSSPTHMNTRQQATSRHLRRLSGIMPRSSSGTAPPQQGLAQQPTVRAAGPDAEVAGCVTASLAAAPAADLIGFSAISIPALAGRPAASAEAREARESNSSRRAPSGTPKNNE